MLSDVLSNEWPCLLQTGSGREESVQIWNGTELVTIAHELLHSLVPVEPKPTSTLKKKPKKKPNNVTLGSNSARASGAKAYIYTREEAQDEAQ